ncbi:hypothetical protein [Parablautia sp. Marseille-Q6255]|uniref:hypothetical protein n=1 Tax=Parablautia sp. Marseille-Q6255 TaxID=3039593 RepID=UPI0024BD1717|nr:hypothetical protein [Parablautia sp. Marseille-Q6255]
MQINLMELRNYHPYGTPAYADFANVTGELMKAVFAGKEDLTDTELAGISRYMGIPLGVLKCKNLIMLSKCNYKHCQMISELSEKLNDIWEMQKQGSHEADLFMQRRGRINLVNLELMFQQGRASYVQYLGVKAEVEDTLLFIAHECKESRRRCLRRTA